MSRFLASNRPHSQTMTTNLISPKQSQMPTNPFVLIIGADAETRLLYRIFLESEHFKIVDAGCFDEVLAVPAYFRSDLILVDGDFSIDDNLETIRRIRSDQYLQKTALIMISGHSQKKVRDQMLSSGADDFLVKPLIYEELASVLRKNIEKFKAKSIL